MTSKPSSTNRAAPPRAKSPLAWTVVGLLVAVALLWWTLHDVSPAEVWGHLRNVAPLTFLASIALATASFPLRTIRWQYLLRLKGKTAPFVPLWHATAIGFAATNLLPARAGEFARAFAAGKLAGARFTTALASIAVERVLDGLTLVALMLLAIWRGGFESDTAVGSVSLGEVVRFAGVLFGALLVAAVVLVRWPGPVLRLLRALLSRTLKEAWADKVLAALNDVVSGLGALRSPSRLLAVTFWSLLIWLSSGLAVWLALQAFGIGVPWSASLLLQSLIAFGIGVQFSPGFFGQYEAIARIGLALYGIGASPAVSFAIGFHLGSFLPITLLGLWSLSRAHLHLADLREARSRAEKGGVP